MPDSINSDKKRIPDFTSLSRDELYKLDIYHNMDVSMCLSQLNKLYGQINKEQDKDIIASISGNTVIDIGSGLGTLSNRLRDQKFDVVSIEPNPDSAKIASDVFGIEALQYSIYNTPFEDDKFETAIMRECTEHLDMELALNEIRRICSKRVIIFQTNLNTLTTLLRKRGGHDEYNPQNLYYYQDVLKKYGFTQQHIVYRDPFAFPLSGGYSCKQLIPHSVKLEKMIVWTDAQINKLLRVIHVQKYLCWRYILIADKP